MSLDAQRVTVLGAGAWGAVLADLISHHQCPVILWSRRYETPLIDAVREADVVISALSMTGVPEVIAQLQDSLCQESQGAPIWVSATKGLNPQTCETPSQLWQRAFPDHRVVVLSGPNLAGEIIQGLPAATVAASADAAAAHTVQKLFNSDRFRVYTNADPIGTELGGTLKNVMAIAAGVCDGLELGINAKSALLTRALPEMLRVGQAFGAVPETFWGLAGLGDLMATCNSALSRNYRVGLGLAQNLPLSQILADIGATAEGVNTAQVLMQVAAQAHIELPISTLVSQLLDGAISASAVVSALMDRPPTAET